MKLRALRIQNFRSLKDLKLESLDNLVVLIGHSGAGKTSIFEALELFFENVDSVTTKLEINDRYWYDRDTSKPISISTDLILDEADFAGLPEPVIEWASLLQKNKGAISISAEINRSSNGNMVWRLTNPNLHQLSLDIAKAKPQQPQPSPEGAPPVTVEKTSNEILLENWQSLLNNIVGGFQWIKGSRFAPPTESSESDKSRKPYIPSMAQDELMQLKNSDEAVDTTIYARVRTEFDEVLTGGRLDYDNQSAVVYEGHIKYPINLLGSGQQSLLFVLLEIIKRRSIVLGVEEPETHLDPGLQRKLFTFLRNRSSQVFVISHSPLFIEREAISCNWNLKKDAQVTVVERIKTAADLKKVFDNLGSRPADALNPNVILMVEGETEEAHIPMLLRKLGGKPNLPGLRVVRLQGKLDKQTAKAWITMSKDTQTEVYLLLDTGAQELIKAAKDAGLSDLNIHEINGTIEDTYPIELIYETLQEIYRIDKNPKRKDGQPVVQLDPKAPRVEEINRYIKEALNINKKDFWKIPLGISVGDKISDDRIEAGLRRFLGRVIQASNK